MKLLFLAVILLVVYVLHAGVLKRPKKAKLKPRSPFRSTSVASGAGACCAVKALETKRFLDVDKVTPRLPLADCDASACHCRYVRHGDRRFNDDDRRHPRSLQSQLYDRVGKADRRINRRGRRRADEGLAAYGTKARGPALSWDNSVSG